MTSNSPSNSSISTTLEISSPETPVNNIMSNSLPKAYSFDNSTHKDRSDVALNSITMQVKGSTVDALRVSVSSAPSTSSHGSAQDDSDASGDVYIWGEVTCDSPSRVSTDSNITPSMRTDILLPKPLESNKVLDVHQIACGVRHAALLTRQGEIFTWGEESGGRLGHGVRTDVTQPCLVETLSLCNAVSVVCGEFHTCAITVAGELYTWGDGTHNAGLLGHGSDVSCWIPKRVLGPLEGLQVASVTCGTWHTALITSTGQLFTFGDGTFGVLGHGNRESFTYPKEVESLMGLKTIAVSCGVWHTAAVVEVIVAQSSVSISSGKLFTWGDGDKNRLGHGDKESRLKPTCVPSLIDYNFHKIACGHSLTVGLTTSGQVFTMGSTVYGQLGNPRSDGKLPCLVEDKLSGEPVEQVACGSYHVAVLTSRNEIYTWGKGANGRLGHGDIEDRKIPTLVEALKDRTIKRIACGSNFTASVCLHKWVSGAEQSQCSACRQTFGFTRKRHNCYNCGLILCHSCSSRKAIGALLSPNPTKPYRVCDTCYLKLNKVLETGAGNNKKSIVPRLSGESKDRFDKPEIKALKNALPANMDLIKKIDTLSLIRTPQAFSQLHQKDATFPRTVEVPKPALSSAAHSGNSSRAVSPFSIRPSPPRSATPIPTTSGLSFSKNVVDSLKRSNELLNQEVQRLRSQVDGLKQRCEVQELELQKSSKKVQEAMALAAEESAKSKSAKEVIKSLTAQLKEMAERLPQGVYDRDNTRPAYLPNGVETNFSQNSDVNGEYQSGDNTINGSHSASPVQLLNGVDVTGSNEMNAHAHNQTFPSSDWRETRADVQLQNGNGGTQVANGRSEEIDNREFEPHKTADNGSMSNSHVSAGNQIEAEWIEQYEPGVYITLVALRDGCRDLKRVRFSRRKFGEHQAEAWWSVNRERVYEKYNVWGSDKASPAASARSALIPGEESFPSPHS
ncbi:Ultraviolet-B receptor UVR8 [Acorus gramineus]|uniref:Ultraviolet-B receptor UVR8 n=1 Tax=Acorus gramineus TaxID=55184 RepID=A0AAV9AK45_ACOGR|nr:Ultraviolet-B receptor UVR8 [Acorus gramineus]